MGWWPINMSTRKAGTQRMRRGKAERAIPRSEERLWCRTMVQRKKTMKMTRSSNSRRSMWIRTSFKQLDKSRNCTYYLWWACPSSNATRRATRCCKDEFTRSFRDSARWFWNGPIPPSTDQEVKLRLWTWTICPAPPLVSTKTCCCRNSSHRTPWTWKASSGIRSCTKSATWVTSRSVGCFCPEGRTLTLCQETDPHRF